MLKVLGPEQDLGIKTIFFTIIGPVINPAGARASCSGSLPTPVGEPGAEVVADLDFDHAMVVHGLDGLMRFHFWGKPGLLKSEANGLVNT